MVAHPVYYIHVSTMCPSWMMTVTADYDEWTDCSRLLPHANKPTRDTLFHSIAENLVRCESNSA